MFIKRQKYCSSFREAYRNEICSRSVKKNGMKTLLRKWFCLCLYACAYSHCSLSESRCSRVNYCIACEILKSQRTNNNEVSHSDFVNVKQLSTIKIQANQQSEQTKIPANLHSQKTNISSKSSVGVHVNILVLLSSVCDPVIAWLLLLKISFGP